MENQKVACYFLIIIWVLPMLRILTANRDNIAETLLVVSAISNHIFCNHVNS